MSLRLGLVVSLFVLAAAPLVAQPDVAYRERRVLTVPSSGRGEMTEAVDVSLTMLSARAAAETEYTVYAQYFNRVSDLEADVDGRAVRRRQFRTLQAQSADVFLSGGTLHTFALEEPLRVGQTLSYRYTRTYPDAGYLPLVHVPDANRTEQFELVVRHPASVSVAFDVASPRGDVPFTATPGATESRLVFAGLERETAMPLFDHNGYHAVVQLRLTADGRALTPTTPEAFAGWYRALVGRVDTTATPRLRTLAESLRRDTPEATIAAIHDHVRGSIRYVADARGESAFVPRAPDLVLERSYGDCKDRVWLATTLARILGLRVDPVLTSTEPAPPVPGVALGLYNHVIGAFDTPDGRRVYFDPTNPHLPFGDLPDVLVGARSLRMGPDGAEEVRLAPQDSLPALDVAVRLDLDRPAGSAATVVLRGSALAPVREARARGTATDAANVVSALAGDALYRVRLSQIALADEQPDAMTFTAQADLTQFVVASPTRRYLPLTPFPAVPTDVTRRRDDALPLELGARPNVRLRIDVPRGTWTAAPSDVAWGGPDAAFEARLGATDDGMAVTYRFQQRARRFDGDARGAYLDLADRYLGARREVLTFTPSAE